MGKIKGWTKKSDGVWRNNKNAMIIAVNDDNEVWLTDVYEDELGGVMLYDAKTREHALNYAKMYMRMRPNG